MAPTTYASIEVTQEVENVEVAPTSTRRRALVAGAVLLSGLVLLAASQTVNSQAPAETLDDRIVEVPHKLGGRAAKWASRRASEKNAKSSSPFGHDSHQRRASSLDEPGWVPDIYTHQHHDSPISSGAEAPVIGPGNSELPVNQHDVYDIHHSGFAEAGACRVFAAANAHCLIRDGPGPGGTPHRFVDSFCFRCPQDVGFGSEYCYACQGASIFGRRRMSGNAAGKHHLAEPSEQWLKAHDGFRVPYGGEIGA